MAEYRPQLQKKRAISASIRQPYFLSKPSEEGRLDLGQPSDLDKRQGKVRSLTLTGVREVALNYK